MSHSKVCPVCNAEYPTETRFCPVDASPLRLIVNGTDLSGRMIASRYELLSKIGEGGMGEVYLAEQITIGRRCAIKVMKPALVDDRDAISRFAREASNASRINHTNVAAVYDFGESDGLLFLVMEYVPGESLSSVLHANEPLSASRVLGISLQIADALAVAHDAGVIHRDLKPDNIMLCTTTHGGELAKVVDFGIAKGMSGHGQTITGTGLVVGTPGYMSPEQLVGDPIDGRSDLYSLACVMYKAMVGESPFGTTAEEQIARRLIEPPPSARLKNPLVPPAIDAVILRALQRDPAHRYQNARELRAALVAAWTASTMTSQDAPTTPWPPSAFSATEILGQSSAVVPRPPTHGQADGSVLPRRAKHRSSAAAATGVAFALVAAATWLGVSAMHRADASPPVVPAAPRAAATQPASDASHAAAPQTPLPRPISVGPVSSIPKASSRTTPVVATKPKDRANRDSIAAAERSRLAAEAAAAAESARVRDSTARAKHDDSIHTAALDAARRADSVKAVVEAARLARVKEEERVKSTAPATELAALIDSFVDAVRHGDASTLKAAGPMTKARDDFAATIKDRRPISVTTMRSRIILEDGAAQQDFTMTLTYRGNFGTPQTMTAQLRAAMKLSSELTWVRDGIVLEQATK